MLVYHWIFLLCVFSLVFQCDIKFGFVFNTLGPVCDDPGYPPDGQQIAVSYEQGSEVQFSCLRPGYEPYSDEPIRCDKSKYY